MPAHRALPRELAQRGGGQALHGGLPGVLQARAHDQRVQRRAQGAQEARERSGFRTQNVCKGGEGELKERPEERQAAKKENDKKKWLKRI